MRITKHGRYGLPNKEEAGLDRTGKKKGMMDPKRACIDESLQKVCTFLLNVYEREMVDYCVEDTMFSSPDNLRDFYL